MIGAGLKVKSSIAIFPDWLISNRVIPEPDIDKVCAVRAVKVSESTILSNSSKPKRVIVSVSPNAKSPAKTETKSTASVKKPLILPRGGLVLEAAFVPD